MDAVLAGAEADAVGEVSQSLNEGAYDRTAAAAIMRRVGGAEQSWVFACDTNNKMRRRVRVALDHPEGSWGSWITVASSQSCAGPPSVGKWAGTSPNEALHVYWRDLNNDLIEVRYKADGSTQTTNLSIETGIGAITGRPVVADVANWSGMTERISVAFIKPNNEVYTLDYYWGAWQPAKPVLKADGTVAEVMTGRSITVGHRSVAVDALLSFQISSSSHLIFKRHHWSHSYAYYAHTQDSGFPRGVITFLGGPTPWRCLTSICAVARPPAGSFIDFPFLADLETGGSLDNRFYWGPGFDASSSSIQGSIRTSNYPHNENEPGYVAVPVADLGHFGYLGGVLYVGGDNVVASAPFPVDHAEGHVVYTTAGLFGGAGPHRLHYANVRAEGPLVDLDLVVIP